MEHHAAVESDFAEEHRAAVESMAAERYILGELKGAERDAFEDHYFDCVECSMSVVDGAKIAATVRIDRTRSQMNWWAAACIVFAVGLAYQNLTPPRIEPPARTIYVISSGQTIPGSSRSTTGSKHVVHAPPGQAVPLTIPFFTKVPGPYHGEMLDAGGRRIGNAFDVPKPDAEDLTVQLLVLPETLHPGNCTLVIRGASGQEVDTYYFEVVPK